MRAILSVEQPKLHCHISAQRIHRLSRAPEFLNVDGGKCVGRSRRGYSNERFRARRQRRKQQQYRRQDSATSHPSVPGLRDEWGSDARPRALDLSLWSQLGQVQPLTRTHRECRNSVQAKTSAVPALPRRHRDDLDRSSETQHSVEVSPHRHRPHAWHADLGRHATFGKGRIEHAVVIQLVGEIRDLESR